MDILDRSLWVYWVRKYSLKIMSVIITNGLEVENGTRYSSIHKTNW